MFKFEQGQIFEDNESSKCFFIRTCRYTGFNLDNKKYELYPIQPNFEVLEDSLIKNYTLVEDSKVDNWCFIQDAKIVNK